MAAVSAPPRRWNHNTHYHPLILGAVPDGCRRSLDVGCGEGMLARDLRRVVPHVTGIDRDAASIDEARRQDADGAVEYVLGDFMTHPFAPGSFDHIASIAALHHMDAAAALERMRGLLAPGRHAGDRRAGPQRATRQTCRSRSPAASRTASTRWASPAGRTRPRGSGRRRRPSPRPPARPRVLPGVRYRRRLLFRYSLVWTKPAWARLRGRACRAAAVGVVSSAGRRGAALQERDTSSRTTARPRITQTPPAPRWCCKRRA